MPDSISIGGQIAFLRKQRGFTQEELAEKLGISAQAISKWENGHTMPETAMLPLLSKYLNSSIDLILSPLMEPLNSNPIKSIEEINGIEKEKAKCLLKKVDKSTIVKASKGVSPAIREYLRELFPDIDFAKEHHEIGAVKISEIESIHNRIVDILNREA